MNFLVLIVMAAALLLAHVLRLSRTGVRVRHLIVFSLTIVLAAGVIRFFAAEAGLERRSPYDGFLADAIARMDADPAPVVAFIGASYSRNALDDRRLTAALKGAGRDMLAVNLSLEGASLQERTEHLRRLLDRAPRAPAIVFFEIAPEFDADPVYVFQVAKFSDRAINQFAPVQTFRALQSLAAGACAGMAACVQSAGLTLAHGGMDALNIGLLYASSARRPAEVRPSYDPQDAPREDVDAARRAAGLADRPAPFEGAPPGWASAERARQFAMVKAAGGEVGVYFPPVIEPDKRAYIAGLCETVFADLPCIAPGDPALLSALDGPVWYDARHLMREGADTFTDWLAGRLDAALP